MKMRYVRCLCALVVCCLAGVLAAPVHAGVVIGSTRVIYPAQDREVTVKLTNEDVRSPVLVQAWIDDGNEKSTPDQLPVPFILTPPIFRMDPGKGQALRVKYLNDKSLPTDKESVFYLNVLEVPPKPKAVGGKASNLMQLAFRTRVKLFLRPKSLKGNVADAAGQLTWKLVTDGAGPALVAQNPSVYHVSFESVALWADGKEIHSDAPQMIAPGGTQRYRLKEFQPAAGAKSEVRFKSIDDYGQFLPHVAVIAS